LFKLPIGLFSGVDGFNILFGLHCGLLLRGFGTVRGYWPLRCRKLFRFVSDNMLKLPNRILLVDVVLQLLKLSCGHFSSLNWIVILFGLHCWLILRDYGTVSSDWLMRCGKLFCRISKYVLKLSRGHFPGVNRVVILFGLHCGLLLRDHGTDSSDWRL